MTIDPFYFYNYNHYLLDFALPPIGTAWVSTPHGQPRDTAPFQPEQQRDRAVSRRGRALRAQAIAQGPAASEWDVLRLPGPQRGSWPSRGAPT